jgi:ubiquinone/menaquinone biosynthesis C-methylase UbiE
VSSDDVKDRVRAQFGAASDAYVVSDVHAHGESLQLVIDAIRPERDWVALDVATGAGHMALAVAPRVRRVVAVDLTPEMLATTAALAARRGVGNLTTEIADAEALPFPDVSFDLITCRLAFHHFPAPERALAEFARVLRPGGVLGFTDNEVVEDEAAAEYYNAYERLRDPSHVLVHSLPALRAMFATAGMTVTAVRRLTKEFEFHDWADRQHVSPADKQRLLDMMRRIPEALVPLFAPRWADGTMYFSLWEAVLAACRPHS